MKNADEYRRQDLPFELAVEVCLLPNDRWEDGIKGFDRADAMDRARGNWPDAEIKGLAGYFVK